MFYNAKQDLDYALAFTRTYQSEPDKALREAKCLALQVPYVLEPIGDEDLIVGYMKHGFVGFSPQYGGSYTYYYWDDRVVEALDSIRDTVDESYIEQIEQMRAFWKKENTEAKVRARFYEKYHKQIAVGRYYYAVCRVAGMNVDLKLLVTEGLPGLRRRIASLSAENSDSTFYDALEMSLDVIADACAMYRDSAEQMLCDPTLCERRLHELTQIRNNFAWIKDNAPRTFKEALQLIWIYAVCSDLMNFGRLDETLGSFYANDVRENRIDEEEAIRWLSSFYKAIIRVSKVHDSRIIIGGKGRTNPEEADKLALLFIETSKRVIDVVPQLTLRYYTGMNEELMDKTLENIAAGAVYPIVYSDETVVPSVMKSYGISEEEAAKHWVPLGCGEYIMEGCGAATPNTGVTLAQALDVVLHRGYDSFTNTLQAENMKDVSEYETFEDLFSAYSEMMRVPCEEMAYHEQLNYQVAGEESEYLYLSLLTHDCMEKGKGIFSGGCRYLCATSEIFGLITCADSLTAIKHCVYDQKLFTLTELVRMLDANFVGYEKERQALLNAPKYGNDDDEADEIAVRVLNNISDLHTEGGKQTNLYRYHIVSVNNSGSAERGKVTSATPCGRKAGEPLSNGNSPSIGGDKNGLTATLNSMRKFDASKHVGVVHNIRFNKDLLKNQFDKIKMLLEIFYENNGVQTNLSSIGKDDLEQAMIHPEKYQNLIVRIGGFSARFVELSPIVQHELLLRTTVEEC